MLSHDSSYQETLKAKLANSMKLIQATTVKPLPSLTSNGAPTTTLASMLTSTPMQITPQQLNNMIILNSPNMNASNMFSSFLTSPNSSVPSFMTASNQIAGLGMPNNSPTSAAPFIIKYTPPNTTNSIQMGNLINNNNNNTSNSIGPQIILTTSNNLPLQSQFTSHQNQFQIINSPVFSNPLPTNNIPTTSTTITTQPSIAATTTTEVAPAATRKPRQKKQPAPQLPPNFSNSKKFKISSIFKPLITKDNHPCLIPSPAEILLPNKSSASKPLPPPSMDDTSIIKETIETIIDKIILDFAREERRERQVKALANRQMSKAIPKCMGPVTESGQQINESILAVINDEKSKKAKKVSLTNQNNCLANEKQFVAGKRKKIVQATENSFVIMNKETKECERVEVEEEKEAPSKRIRLNEDEEKGNTDDDEEVVKLIVSGELLSSSISVSEDSSCSQSVKDESSSTTAANSTGRAATCTFCQKSFANTSNL